MTKKTVSDRDAQNRTPTESEPLKQNGRRAEVMGVQIVGNQVDPRVAQEEREALSSLPAKLAWGLVTLLCAAVTMDILGPPQSTAARLFIVALLLGALAECMLNISLRRKLNYERPGKLFRAAKLFASLNSAGVVAIAALMFGDAALQGLHEVIAALLGICAGAIAASRSSVPRIAVVDLAQEETQASSQLSESDRYMAAIHEAGHALALALVPKAWREGAFVQIGGVKNTFTHAPRDNSIWSIAPYRRWEMLLMLAGPVAADRAYGAPMEGGAADMREWRHKGMAVLTAERTEGWTPAPETELEYQENQRLLKAMERQQTQALNKFFDVNRDVYYDLVDHLLLHNGASPEELDKFLERVVFCEPVEAALGL